METSEQPIETVLDVEALSTDDEFEVHRPYLRKLDKDVSRPYGVGGGLILIFAIGVPLVWAYFNDAWKEPLLYIVIVILVCLGFYILRYVVKCELARLEGRFLAYCEVNRLDVVTLCHLIRNDGIYTFLADLVAPLDTELKPKEIGDSKRQDPDSTH